MILVIMFLAIAGTTFAQYKNWEHSGSLYLDTTPEGANLPATAHEKDFPLLIRLNKDWFDFSRAKLNGEDIRFSTSRGASLPYQIEQWDAAAGTADIWVRIPAINGNAHQELKLHWGKADAANESNGAALFNESNGYLSVQHLNESVKDEVGSLEAQDTGTTSSAGMIGKGRHFPGGKGIFCGDKIANFPTGAASHSSQAWFRPIMSNGRVIGWGNEQRVGKVIMDYRSPSHILIECYFSSANVKSSTKIPRNQWVHVVHTYRKDDSRVYINGILDGVNKSSSSPLSIKKPAKMWIGGWYNNYDFKGDIDEVRISRVVRSADWIKLEYENQKPLQTLVGPLVQKGSDFSVSEKKIEIAEGKSTIVSARAGGARKVFWILKKDGQEKIAAVDRFSFTFDAGRVKGDESVTIQFKAVYANEVKTLDLPVTVKEEIPEPIFILKTPAKWDGRETIEIVPQISNLKKMQSHGAAELKYKWNVTGLAVIKEIKQGKLILQRAQNSGKLSVKLTINNGGADVSATTTILVKEPRQDAWVRRPPAKDEKPEDNQFYARDDKNEGTLYCNGTLEQAADSLFLKLYADDKLIKTLKQKPTSEKNYAFTVKLKPGLIKYKIELGYKTGSSETILHTAGNLVCGDAYIIDGQSNALATDTGQESPRQANDWIRSYARPRHYREGESQNLWCNPVWKARAEHKAELGWW